MANFNDIKHEIDQNVNTNGVQAITGAILNETLKDMIDEVDEKKQDTLVAGSGISINGNVISATGGGGGQEYYAGHGINIDSGNNISVDASDLAGSGLEVDEFGALKTDPSLVQEKLQAGANIQISGNTISATDTTYGAGQGLQQNGNVFSVKAGSGLGFDANGNLINTGGGGGGATYTAGSGIDIDSNNVISAKTGPGLLVDPSTNNIELDRSALNFLPLEGGQLQATTPGDDTTLTVMDGMNEDYVRIVAPETQGAPHVEIFENGSGDTKFYYDHLERGTQVSIDYPTQSGTLALTSDIPYAPVYSGGNAIDIDASTNAISVNYSGGGLYLDGNNQLAVDYTSIPSEIAGNGLQDDGNGHLEVDTSVVQEKLVAGQNITISGNVISATGGSGGNYLPLDGGTLQDTTGSTQTRLQLVSPNGSSAGSILGISSNYGYGNITIGTAQTDQTVLQNDLVQVRNATSGKSLEITSEGFSDGSVYHASLPTLTQDEILATQSDVNTAVSGKQDTLTAGSGISIVNNVISATGGSGGSLWTSGTGTDSLFAPGTGSDIDYVDPSDPSQGINNQSESTGTRSIATGSFTHANGSYSAAFGELTSAYGQSSFATGYATNAGDFAFASGMNTSANGVSSAAFGNQTYASNESSFAAGSYLQTGNTNQAVFGTWNDASYPYNYLFTIGDGEMQEIYHEYGTPSWEPNPDDPESTDSWWEYNEVRKNVVDIKTNGDVFIEDIGGYDGTNSSTSNATRLQDVINGKQDTLTAGSGISIQNNVISATGGGGSGLWTSGTGTGSVMSPGAFQANGNNSVSAGDYTRSNGTSSIALGTSTTTTGLSAAAIGANSTAAGSYSVALGHGLGAVNTDETALGKFNNYIDTGTTAEKTFFTVGNGTSNNTKSNVLEIKQNDDIYVSGIGGFDGTNASSADTLQDVIAGKQDTLVAGANITISGNVISATGGSGSSYSAGQGIDITNNTISVDNTIATVSDLQGYLPLVGGQLQANPSDAETLLDVAAPDSTSAISMSADTIDSKLAISADKANAGISDGDTFRTVLSNTGEIQVAAKTVNPQDPTDIGETTYTLVLPQKNDTIATLSDIQGGGSSYTAGAGINIDANNAISSTTFVPGTGTGSIMSLNANRATGADSIAMGDGARATGNNAVAIGYSASAQKNDSISLGGYVDGSNSFGGPGTVINTNANYSVALGYNSQVDAEAGVALGYNSKTVKPYEYTIGKYNKTYSSNSDDTRLLFSIGNGTSSLARSNALEIKNNNDVYVYGVGGFDGTNASSAQTLQDVIANAGGGGTTYTAGQAIDITNGAISVDYGSGLGLGTNGELQVEWSEGPTALAGSGLSANTQNGQLDVDFTSVQGKLTAGSGITISGNTISATGGGGSGLWTSGTGQDSLVSPGAAASSQGSDASGIGAIVIGEDSNANGDYSFAHGQGTMANGDYSAAFVSSNSTGDYSFAAGTGADAQAAYSVAIGTSATTVFDNSDPNAPINAESSIAIGGITYGMNSVAIGPGSAARGERSVALGDTSEASGVGSFAQGYASHANGLYSSAFAGSTASANYSFAASTGQAYAHYSTAVSGAEAFGEGAFAAGQGNQAYGYGAAALGFMAQTYSQADGTDVSDPNAGEVALGRYNYSEQGIVFTVGCGYLDETDPDNPVDVRQNAVAIDSTGKIFLKGLGGYTGTSTSGCTDLVSFLNNL